MAKPPLVKVEALLYVLQHIKRGCIRILTHPLDAIKDVELSSKWIKISCIQGFYYVYTFMSKYIRNCSISKF